MKIKMKKWGGVSCVWLNLEKKKGIKKIKVKKCVGVSCVAECVGVEKSREREKRNGMFYNESGRNGSSLVKKKSIKKS